MATEKITHNLRAELYGDLAKFAKAGFGLDRAFLALADQRGVHHRVQRIARSAANHLAAGRTIADSLQLAEFQMSALEYSMIEAAERGGVLEIGFRHLADHFRQEHDARIRIRRAMIYPLFLLHAALLVGIFVPALLKAALPDAPGAGFAESIRAGFAWAGAGYAVAILLFLAWRRLNAAAAKSPLADRLVRSTPLFGPARKAQALARFCEVLRIQLLAGQRMSHAWESAGAVSQSGLLRAATAKQAARFAGGESINSVVSQSRGVFPGNFARSLAAADLAGQLDEDVAHWADYYRQNSAESVERLARWAPKIFYFLVMMLAAWMVIRFALAYRDLLEGYMDWGENI